MKSHPSKSSFHKLYLIDVPMYEKCLSYLNEVDRQELKDLNDEHRPEYMASTDNDENGPQESDEVTQPVSASEEPDENEADLQSPIEDRDAPTIHLSKKEAVHETHSTKQKKPKKFSCEHCIKKFTTKYSMNRHKKLFHEDEPLVEDTVVNPSTNMKEPEEKIPFSKGPSRYSIYKKKQQELQKVENDNTIYKPQRPSSRYTRIAGVKYKGPKEPMTTRKRQRTEEIDELQEVENDDTIYKPQRPSSRYTRIAGVKYKGPKEPMTTRKRQRTGEIDDMQEQNTLKEESSLPNRGIKRKGPKRATDNEPRKKLRWINYV